MRAAAIVVAASCSLAIAGTTDDRIPDAEYIRYAEGFASYTARLNGKNEKGQRCYASATMISDNWALTAAHVVEGMTGLVVVASDGSKHDVAEVVIHRDFADDFGGDDIALLRVTQPFGLPFYPELATGNERVGDTVSIAGYGVSGRLSAGHTTEDGKLRAGTNKIVRFERGMIICDAKRGSSPLEFCIAPGDSGGPLFCRGVLAGVNVITMADRGPLKSKEGEESGHTQVSLHREWIDNVIGGAK